MMKVSQRVNFAVRIVTYPRPDGKTPLLLRETIKSLNRQTYDRWTAYVVGDMYTPNEEFDSFAELFPKGKAKLKNVCIDPERMKFNDDRRRFFGGINAINFCLDWIAEDNMKHVAILDHDDIWRDNHLESLAEAYHRYEDLAFAYTSGIHETIGVLPRQRCPTMEYDNLKPTEENMIHSSASWRVDLLPLRYRYNYRADGKPVYGDMTMWGDMRSAMKENGLKCMYIDRNTVYHDGV